jgi:hypothetical protein
MEIARIARNGIVALGLVMSGAAMTEVVSGASLGAIAAGALAAFVGVFVVTITS